MVQKMIGIGTSPNDGNGDDLRTGGGKINDNFTELYSALGGKQAASSALTNLAGVTPIADGAHSVGGITITTSKGLITAIIAT